MAGGRPLLYKAVVKTLRYTLCDVFTEEPLAGNPLAVFTDARALDERTMQALARELNLSETTFVLPPERGGHARVRIFTPAAELPFAGHPTLGTAFVLGGPLEVPELRLELAAGVVPVRLEREAARVAFGWMVQPAASATQVGAEAAIAQALGGGAAPLAAFAFRNGPEHVYLELPSEDAVGALAPNGAALAAATSAGVCAFWSDGQRAKVRYFAPAHGVAEDPATGSAAGPLALWLTGRGRLAEGAVLRIEQGAEVRRRSTLYARVTDAGAGIVEVGGSARIVARGQFVL